MEENEDEENPFGDKWGYGYPLGADSEEEDEEELEFCPFCGEMVETIDGECIECGNRTIEHEEKEQYQTLEYLFKEELMEKIKINPENPKYCYDMGKKLFKEDKPSEEWFRKAITLDPNFHLAYYYLGRLHLEKGKLIEAEDNFKKSLSGPSNLPWPHYYLGKAQFKKGDFTGAESELKKALELYPNLESARGYLDEIKLRKSKLEFPMTVEEVEKLTENVMLTNHALIEWFETNMRDFVKTVLEKEYGEKWWRKGVPLKVRRDCAGRMEECPEEELSSPKLSFVQFYHYATIIEAKGNKNIFKSYLNVPEWVRRLNRLETIRNGIMHCRGRHLSNERNLTLRSWCRELEEIMKKLNKNPKT
jgi:tetratricopeptide (TPR) repeat protein